MANKKISELSSRTPALSDLMIVGDPSSGYSYKCTITALATIIETDIADGYVTIGTTQTISGAKTFSNNLTLTSVANAATTQTKFLTLNGSNVVNYRTGAEVLSDIGGQASLSGTGLVKSTSGTISYITDNSSNWNTAYNDSIVSAAVSGTTTKTLTLTQQDGGTLTASWSDLNTDAVTSVFGRIGAVVATEGDYSLNLLSDVTLTSPSNGQVLKYNGTAWINDTDANTGTVTSVGLSSATSGVTIGSTPITTSGTITLAIATASSSQQGLLSSTDWTTFNNKQNALTNPVTGTGTTNYIPKFTGTSAIGNSIIYDNGTTVSIGTTATNANEKLKIDGGRLVVLGGSDVYQLKLAYNNATAGFWLGSPSANALAFYNDAGAERMRLDANGALFVGITSAYGDDIARFYNSSNADRYVYVENPNGGASAASFVNVLAGAGANLRLGAYGVNHSTQANNATIFNHKATGSLLFGTVGTERMRLDASGNLIVGGTSAVYGASGRGVITINGSSQSLLGFTVGGADKGFLYHTGTDMTLSNTANGFISFQTNNTERARIDASGNLGLGTSSPALENSASITEFTITKSGQAANVATANLQGDRSGDGTSISRVGTINFWQTSNNIARINGLRYGTNNSGGISFETNNAGGGLTERMRLDASGNLGLGVTPSAWSGGKAIQVKNSSNPIFISETNGDGWFGYNAYYNGTNWTYVGSYYANAIKMADGNFAFMSAPSGTAGNAISFTQAMTLFSTGNLAVGGTSDNGYKLEVNGVSRSKGEALLGNFDNLTDFGQVGIYSTSSSWADGFGSLVLSSRSDASRPIIFTTYNGSSVGERMRITSGGELLINTTSDAGDFKLQVNGNTYTNGSLTTAAPSGGTAAAWKLGEAANSSIALNSQYVQIDINGTQYLIPTCYTL